MSVSDCIFCSIASGTIPVPPVYETDNLLAFRDMHPQAPVHILVIPKDHIASLAHAGGEQAGLLGELIFAAAEVAREQKLDAGYRVVINIGDDGGQTVQHLHLHVLGGRAMSWPPG